MQLYVVLIDDVWYFIRSCFDSGRLQNIPTKGFHGFPWPLLKNPGWIFWNRRGNIF